MLVLKVKLGEDVRRITVENLPNFAELFVLLKNLFPSLSGPFQVKYCDEDNDMITITSDIELKEALSVTSVTQSSFGSPVLRLFLFTPNTATPSVPVREEPKPVPQPQPQAAPNGAPFMPPFMQLLQNPQLQSLLSQFFPQSGNQPSIPDLTALFQNLGLSGQTQQSVPVQPTPPNLGDLLNNPLVQRFMDSVLQNAQQATPATPAQSNASQEEKTEIYHPGVICDGCGGELFGNRFKCNNCPDFDLCQSCEAKGGMHDPSHIFLKIPMPLQAFRGCPYRRPAGFPKNGGRWGNHSQQAPKQQAPAPARFLARFVCDVNIEDATPFNAEQRFVKIWKMRNEGETAWPEGTQLNYVGGDKLSAVEYVTLPVVQSGAEVDVAVDMQAPHKPGRYISYWRLSTPDGIRFGQRIWADITVIQALPQQPAPKVEVQPSNNMEVEKPQVVATPVITPVVVTPVTPVVTPIVTSPAESPEIAESQKLLLEMGFINRDLNREILIKNKNDVMRTIQELLTLPK